MKRALLAAAAASIAASAWALDTPQWPPPDASVSRIRELQQVIIAASGSFDVIVDDGVRRERVTLNRSHLGLYVPRLVWREIENFSSGAVTLVLASEPYDENDYFRDYDEFVLAASVDGDR